MSRLVPLALFVLLAVLLGIGLMNADRKSELPSPLIGKPVPDFNLPALFEPEQRYSPEAFAGAPYLVNFWASWCVTCRVEHPVIEELADRGLLRIVGMNFRDEEGAAKAWLRRFGDPYDIILFDEDGRVSIDFGVYAAPETFLVDANGTIVFKQIGALTEEVIAEEIVPRISTKVAGGAP
ncbi:MAG: DsbE family thiol:disulfide interchange protein [Gammaproteobacteria bacterium]